MFGIDYYDAILLSGQYQVEQVRALEKLRALPAKEIVKVGIPYMDDMLARLHADPPLPEHERTVLLAPSWGESAILKKYGGRIIDTLLATGYHIIIRPHPQSFPSPGVVASTTEALRKLSLAKALLPSSMNCAWMCGKSFSSAGSSGEAVM